MFFPFSLALLYMSHQAKREHDAGNYQEAMYRMRRVCFYCNIVLALLFGPLLLLGIMAFIAEITA